MKRANTVCKRSRYSIIKKLRKDKKSKHIRHPVRIVGDNICCKNCHSVILKLEGLVGRDIRMINRRTKMIPRGWEWKGVDRTRPIRDRESGLFGQNIWYKLENMGFVKTENFGIELTVFEKRLRNWLIWGYWEI